MKVLHVPFTYSPDPVGGTEIYVQALIRSLRELGTDCAVAAPGVANTSYYYEGVCVHRMQKAGRDVLTNMYGRSDMTVARRFRSIMNRECPDLVHLHAFNGVISRSLVQEAVDGGSTVLFTYHTPTASCLRGTLMRWGATPCDGKLDIRLCTDCQAHQLGMNRVASYIIGNLPPRVGRAVEKAGFEGSIWTGVRLSQLAQRQHDAFRLFISSVSHIVAVCDWVRDLLIRNGAPKEKVSVCRQGLCCPEPAALTERSADSSGTLRLAYFGRLEAEKGVHVVLEALRLLPGLDLQFDVFGIVQGPSGQACEERLRVTARGDRRVGFRRPVNSNDVARVMQSYDLIAIPSQCLETGPLVALEAFSARVPPLASDLGGARELIHDGINGRLIEAASPQLWADAIRQCCFDRSLVRRLRAGIERPRTMEQVAEEMNALYARLLRTKGYHVTAGANSD